MLTIVNIHTQPLQLLKELKVTEKLELNSAITVQKIRLLNYLSKGDDSAWIAGSSNGDGEHRVGAQQGTRTSVHQTNIELLVGGTWKRFVDSSNRSRQQSLSREEGDSNGPETWNMKLASCEHLKHKNVKSFLRHTGP